MKLKFKLQKALVQQQQSNDNAMKMEESALHGLAAVAAAVEQADTKGGLLDNKFQAGDALDISAIKLEREESCSPQDLSTNSSEEFAADPSRSINFNIIIKPKANEPSVSESIETDIPVKIVRCRPSEESQYAATTSSSLSPSAAGTTPKQHCPMNIAALSSQQQVRVIQDGRYYEGSHNLPQSALLALNGKQDLRITQISNSSGCGQKSENMSRGNLVNVITIGNAPMALDTVKMKLGENDTQIFRAPMVSSTTNQHHSAGAGGGGGVVVTVESSNCSMRPPAAPPRMHHLPQQQQQQQIMGNGNGMKVNKQCPSSTTQGGHHHQQSLSPGASEEPSSSIPDLGESSVPFLLVANGLVS